MSGSKDVYIPIPTRKVRGFSHTEIQGVPVPKSPKELHVEDINDFFLVGDPRERRSASSITLSRISPDHGRSYEVHLPGRDYFSWKDPYDNVFSSLSLKGNNLDIPHIFRQETSHGGFSVFGLQDSNSIVRVLKASELLRAHHVDTEMILGVLEPVELPRDKEVIPIAEFKQRLIQDLFERVRAASVRRGRNDIEFSPEDIPRINLQLEKQMFLFTLRGMQVSERISDLKFCKTEKEFKAFMAKIFRFVNNSEREKARSDPYYEPQLFNPDSMSSIREYFTHYLPTRAASNFATLHNLGLSHGFSHAGNISLVGSLYDLDSIQGKAVDFQDKEEIQSGRMNTDIFFFLYGHELFNDTPAAYVSAMGVKDAFEALEQRGIMKKVPDALFPTFFSEFSNTFLRQYIRERGWESDLMRHLPEINAFFLHFDFPQEKVYREQAHYYVDLLLQQTGQTYGSEEDLARLVDTFVSDFHEEALENLRKVMSANPNDKNYFSLFDKHRELHAKIEAIEERRKRLEEIIASDFRERNADRLKELTPQYNKETVDTLTTLVALCTATDVRDASWKSGKERWVENDLGREIMKAIGWEESVVSHLADIVRIFSEFIDPIDEEFYDYYADKLASEIGWSYRYTASSEELIEVFHQREQEEVRSEIKKMLSESGKYQSIEKTVGKVLRKRNEIETLDRLDGILAEEIGNAMERDYKDEVERLYVQYDKKVYEILDFFIRRTRNQVFRFIMDGRLDELEERTNQRFALLRKEFETNH